MIFFAFFDSKLNILIGQNYQFEDVAMDSGKSFTFYRTKALTARSFFFFNCRHQSFFLLLVSFLAESLLFLSPLNQQQQPPHSVYPAFMVSVQGSY